MNDERWDRILEIVEAALARPESERPACIASACGDESDLYEEVISLLDAPPIEDIPTSWLGALGGPEPPCFESGQRVADRYVIGRLLGSGGMGEVYEARDEELSITVALKTLRLADSGGEALQQLKLEGLLARAVWHPNVCRVYDLGRHIEDSRTVWFLTMELLQGRTLAEKLRDDGRLPLDRVLGLAEQMAAGLGAAHQAGVVHRDFKPGNVMLVAVDGLERAVVTDFGTARAARTEPGPDPRVPGVIVGTPAYMAPEQVAGKDVGPAADIYALGVVLYELVTGALPFPGGSAIEVARRRLEEDPPAPRTLVPELDSSWNDVIVRCLAREPDQRFGRAEDVASALLGRTPVQAIETGFARHGRHTLPPERDAFVGRQTEIGILKRVLAGDPRVVTILGAGGMGKTRLAVHCGWASLETWPGGVWFCDLTDARDRSGLAFQVAGSLGVPIGRGDPVAQLGHAIAGRGHCLVILDNFETVAGHAGETLGRWLELAPEARFLATSRERLNMDGEWVVAVEPLSIEAGLNLFALRAKALHPGLDLVGSEAEAAREIVRLVDGMPLAIELAAARVRVMSVAGIVAGMRRRFHLLTGGRNAHHETLEGTIDGSWDLLRPWEKAAWAQASVFEGGFTLAAAEAGLDLGPWPEAPWIIDVLQRLVDKSLLRTTVPEAGSAAPAPRFGMYASLQEYARGKLGPAETLAAERRHGTFYARHGASEACEALDRPGGAERWRHLERELDNLLAACRRSAKRGDGPVTSATFSAAWGVIKLRGPFDTIIDLGREALRDASLERADRAAIIHSLGEAATYAGLLDDADGYLKGALGLARELGDRRLEGRALCNLGRAQHDRSRLADSLDTLRLALTAVRDAGDRRYEGVVLNAMGMAHHLMGEIEAARSLHEEALVVARMIGDRRTEGVTLSNLGIVYQNIGRTTESGRLYEAALTIHREMGNRRSEAIVQANLGSLKTDQGHMADARLHLEAALAINRSIGARRSEGIALTALGELLGDQEETEEALAFLEAALVIHREVHDQNSEGVVLGNLGRLLHRQGRLVEARSHYEAALALHREVGDRRYEGSVLTSLGSLHQEEGSMAAAAYALDEAEQILRGIDARVEVGKLLCTRAEFERRVGNVAAFTVALQEATTIALEVGAGPDSELARLIARTALPVKRS